MKIDLTSVFVDDQDKALKFYTEVLGFVKKTEIPLGEDRWLTVVSPDDPGGTELLLEPDGTPLSVHSSRRSSPTGFRSPRSLWTTSKRNTSACGL